MSEILEVFKGTDKDMKCHNDFQYELGKTVTDDDAIRCGNKGFHSCEAPFDVLRYFGLRNGNRFFRAEAGGKIDRSGARDSKLASSELTLTAEIGLPGLIKAQFAFTRKKAQSGEKGGDYSNLAGGYGSNLAGGKKSLILGGHGSKAKGGLHSVIVLTEWGWADVDYRPVCVKAEIVDGEKIKADTWYQLKDGEFVAAEEEP